MASFDETLKAANQQLKEERVPVRIKRRWNALFLVATLPPKPTSKKSKPHQQEVSLNKLSADLYNLPVAIREARQLSSELDCGKFDWSERSKKVKAQTHKTIGDHIKEYEKNYWRKHDRSDESRVNWRKEYKRYFDKLNPKDNVELERFVEVIEVYKPNTRSRARICQKLVSLALFCEMSYKDIEKIRGLKGNYSIRSAKKRNILTDKEILELRVRIPPGPVRWLFEALVVWGLRPHEVYEIDMEKLRDDTDYTGIISVYSKKTKCNRIVSPLYRDWFLRWKMWEGMPPSTTRKKDLGQIATYKFDQYNFGIQPYDLRHTWAVRALYYPGIDEAQAARMMGHSLIIHQKVYENWISESRARQEQLKQLNPDYKFTVPEDPPEDPANYFTTKTPLKKVAVASDGHTYERQSCKHCGSNNVIWAGFCIQNGKNYGKSQVCKACNKTQLVKPISLAHASTS